MGTARAILAAVLATPLLACAGMDAALEAVGSLSDPPVVRDERARARQGDSDAALAMGRRYEEGDGVARSGFAAARWYRRSAEAGNAEAQYRLALAQLEGRGVAMDAAEAARWLEAAAVQGHALAAFRLAEVYAVGRGVAREPLWALRWYGEAAEAGMANAQHLLGMAHAGGLGFDTDPSEALRWLLIAERHGHADAAAMIPEIAGRLRWEQRFAAEQRAAAWSPRPGSPAPLVRFVQQALGQAGFPAGPVDGVAGPRTLAAVGRFRQEKGLGAGGIDAILVGRLRAELRGDERH